MSSAPRNGAYVLAIARCDFQTGPSGPDRAIAALLLYQLLELHRVGVGDGMVKIMGNRGRGKSVYTYKKANRQPKPLQDLMSAIVTGSFAALASVPTKGTS